MLLLVDQWLTCYVGLRGILRMHWDIVAIEFLQVWIDRILPHTELCFTTVFTCSMCYKLWSYNWVP